MNSGTSAKVQTGSHKTRHIVLQWHITERCNWRCAHCYQDDYRDQELPFQGLIEVVEQFKALLDLFSQETTPIRVSASIHVSGGEPFIRKDFLDLLEVFSANRELFSFSILTNGSMIDASMARRLHDLSPAYVQVSLEGNKETNDQIRGSGAFDKTVSALKHLERERIRSVISFTAHRINFREFPEVARLGRQLGAFRVWADRLIPWGSGSTLEDNLLSPEETREFFEIMYSAHNEAARSFCRTEVSMRRALQFLIAGGEHYRCAGGNNLITVQPNGDLYPCRRMPILVGNIMDTPLIDLYYKSELFQDLRNPDRISVGCEECSFVKKCRGGLKCLSYAVTGDPFNADPGCWLARSKRKPIDDEAQ
jgi:radical SAM protein with 4Fe4S-binding SPASM domain